LVREPVNKLVGQTGWEYGCLGSWQAALRFALFNTLRPRLLSVLSGAVVLVVLQPVQEFSAMYGPIAVAAGSASVDSYSQSVLADNPIAYWRFDEAPGSTTVADATGHGYSGTLQGGVTLGATGAVSGNSAAQGIVGLGDYASSKAPTHCAPVVKAVCSITGGGTISSRCTQRTHR
jgi:hypothetical protein